MSTVLPVASPGGSFESQRKDEIASQIVKAGSSDDELEAFINNEALFATLKADINLSCGVLWRVAGYINNKIKQSKQSKQSWDSSEKTRMSEVMCKLLEEISSKEIWEVDRLVYDQCLKIQRKYFENIDKEIGDLSSNENPINFQINVVTQKFLLKHALQYAIEKCSTPTQASSREKEVVLALRKLSENTHVFESLDQPTREKYERIFTHEKALEVLESVKDNVESSQEVQELAYTDQEIRKKCLGVYEYDYDLKTLEVNQKLLTELRSRKELFESILTYAISEYNSKIKDLEYLEDVEKLFRLKEFICFLLDNKPTEVEGNLLSQAEEIKKIYLNDVRERISQAMDDDRQFSIFIDRVRVENGIYTRPTLKKYALSIAQENSYNLTFKNPRCALCVLNELEKISLGRETEKALDTEPKTMQRSRWSFKTSSFGSFFFLGNLVNKIKRTIQGIAANKKASQVKDLKEKMKLLFCEACSGKKVNWPKAFFEGSNFDNLNFAIEEINKLMEKELGEIRSDRFKNLISYDEAYAAKIKLEEQYEAVLKNIIDKFNMYSGHAYLTSNEPNPDSPVLYHVYHLVRDTPSSYGPMVTSILKRLTCMVNKETKAWVGVEGGIKYE